MLHLELDLVQQLVERRFDGGCVAAAAVTAIRQAKRVIVAGLQRVVIVLAAIVVMVVMVAGVPIGTGDGIVDGRSGGGGTGDDRRIAEGGCVQQMMRPRTGHDERRKGGASHRGDALLVGRSGLR